MSSFESSTYVFGQDEMTALSFRILSLDGGGIRGLSGLIILDEIINCFKYALKSPVDLLPADYFDMMSGTSTRGRASLFMTSQQEPDLDTLSPTEKIHLRFSQVYLCLSSSSENMLR